MMPVKDSISQLSISLADVAAALEVDAPAVVLRAGWAQDIAVAELDRLVLDRPEDAFGQAAGVRPR